MEGRTVWHRPSRNLLRQDAEDTHGGSDIVGAAGQGAAFMPEDARADHRASGRGIGADGRERGQPDRPGRWALLFGACVDDVAVTSAAEPVDGIACTCGFIVLLHQHGLLAQGGVQIGQERRDGGGVRAGDVEHHLAGRVRYQVDLGQVVRCQTAFSALDDGLQDTVELRLEVKALPELGPWCLRGRTAFAGARLQRKAGKIEGRGAGEFGFKGRDTPVLQTRQTQPLSSQSRSSAPMEAGMTCSSLNGPGPAQYMQVEAGVSVGMVRPG